MAIEIEKKFLVSNDTWRVSQIENSLRIKQGYVHISEGKSVRVRIIGKQAVLTLKANLLEKSRFEYEYDIPLSDAEEMHSTMCTMGAIEKIRHYIKYEGMLWELDEFLGPNSGLFLCEVELNKEDQHFKKPEWAGRDVSYDINYLNSTIASKNVVTTDKR